MSFYRTVIAGVAALGLSAAVFAADDTVTTTTTTDTQTGQTTTETSAPAEAKQVNINTATAKELAKVDGLTSAKAKAIVSYRKKHGDFKSLDDLKEVKGFKKMDEETLKKVEAQLTLS